MKREVMDSELLSRPINNPDHDTGEIVSTGCSILTNFINLLPKSED
jgi:hypothetical protein